MSEIDDKIKLRLKVEQIDGILRGDPSTGKGGLVALTEKNAEALYGHESNPGGLIKDVSQLKRVLWLCTGGLFAVEIAAKILPALIQALTKRTP